MPVSTKVIHRIQQLRRGHKFYSGKCPINGSDLTVHTDIFFGKESIKLNWFK